MKPRLIVYVDTSAAAGLLVHDVQSPAVSEWLEKTTALLVSSDLLETELRRLAVRGDLDQALVSTILHRISLASLDRSVFREAGLLPIKGLRSLDALHLQAALRLNATAILTYDRQLANAAAILGLEAISP